MKILYFYQYFTTPKGSWSTRVYESTRRWVARGHEVTVITAPYEKSDIKPKGFISKLEVDGIKVVIINIPDSNRIPIIYRVVRAISFSSIATFFALFKKYDIAIASSGPLTVGFPMILAKIIRRRKTVFEVRDLWPAGGIEIGYIKSKWQKKLTQWFEKTCYKCSDLIITVSPGQKAHIKNRFPDLKIEVFPHGADLDIFGTPSEFKLPDWTKGKSIFAHIGSLGVMNNCMSILQAVKVLKSKGYSHIIIVFIGEGAEREKLEKFKYDNDLDNVYFLGLLPKIELPIWVQSSISTILDIPNTEVMKTASPNKVFDSLAAATPIIQSSLGWIKELIEKEKCGINVKPEDPEDMANAMILLVENQELRRTMSENAKQLALTEFNRDHIAQNILSCLIEIAR